MDEYSLRLAKPHCSECHKPKGVIEKLDDLLETGEEMAVTRMEFSENRAIKQGEIPGELSLFDRLKATIKAAQQEVDEEI